MASPAAPDAGSYLEKKAFFDQVLTVYGRKPVLEALRDNSLQCHALHLATSNRENSILRDITQVATARRIEIKSHSRQSLARISRNGKQDQGVALDIVCPTFRALADYLAQLETVPRRQRLLALDGINNPQNFGMIIRSVAAAGMDGIIWSRRGNAALGPLVIKASAGTLYRAPLLLASSLGEALQACRHKGIEVCVMEAGASNDVFQHRPSSHCVYVLGNETDGVSSASREAADTRLGIPMQNGIESLNVAVSASLIAYASYLER